jgi:GAF domain-containing protein
VSLPDRELQVGQAFVALADTLVEDYDVVDLLDQLVAHSVSLLAADAAGIMLGDARSELRVVASSSEDAQTMELLQLQSNEGPCLDCYQSVTQVRVPDLAAVTDRWPGFVAAVTKEGGYRSVHALPLRLRGQAIGAMNLFHRRPGPLPEPDLALGQALADVATIAILSEREIHRSGVVIGQLQHALNSRVIIEQAKGIIANRLGLDMATAFELLRTHSRNNNERLSTVAGQIVDGHRDSSSLSAATTIDRSTR